LGFFIYIHFPAPQERVGPHCLKVMGFRQNFSGRRRHHVIAPAVLSLSRKHVDGWVTIYQ